MAGKRKEQKNKTSEKLRDDSLTLRQQGRGPIPSDVLGSYTGTPEVGEVPEQDADDL